VTLNLKQLESWFLDSILKQEEENAVMKGEPKHIFLNKSRKFEQLEGSPVSDEEHGKGASTEKESRESIHI